MSIDPCPTCKGNCCGYTLDLRHKDGHKGNPFHYCPDCDDGTRGEDAAGMYDEQHQMQQLAEEDAWLRAEVERLKAENELLRGERPAVVALLREEERLYEKHWWLHVASSLRRLCDAIERGEHRREEGA